MKKFEPINKEIRNKDCKKSKNLIENDALLNECLIDTTIELLNKERMYGDAGEPFPWSNRTRSIKFKFDANNPNKLAEKIESELSRLLKKKLGLMTEGISQDLLSTEQINAERERKNVEDLKEGLIEQGQLWSNLELEETQLKMEATESIFDQLNNEVIEILEHIQYSRKNPELYQNKSIYACVVIPKLAFQDDSSAEENEGDEENDLVNV